MPVYLDTAATTPVAPEVAHLVLELMTQEFGNAGSRTHHWGTNAKRRVQQAREQIASVAFCQPDEVVFTSGATESNNLAIMGLETAGVAANRRHIISCATEHKAVLEPLQALASRGFDVELVVPDDAGVLDLSEVLSRVRLDTLLVSVMHVNNETGVIQMVEQLAEELCRTETLLHVDAAQSFARVRQSALTKVDLVSSSAHKIAGPKGVGALICRRRGWLRPPLEPLLFGGGQERGLRPGTSPVPLLAGFGLAAEILNRRAESWGAACERLKKLLVEGLTALGAQFNGSRSQSAPNILNVAIPGVDAEALIVALQGKVGLATGSACTSSSFEPSHVLAAMGVPSERIGRSIRLSWWSDTSEEDCKVFLSELSLAIQLVSKSN